MNRFFSHALTAAIGATIGAVLTIGVLFYWQLFPLAEPGTPSISTTLSEQDQRPEATEPHAADPLQLVKSQNQTIAELEQEIYWLESIIDDLVSSTADQDAPNASSRPAAANASTNQQLWFDEDSLLSLGIDEQSVTLLKERVEAVELEKLELRNQATREGWGRGGQLYTKLREIDKRFKESLSAEDYDIVLYASGKNNRIAVTDTLSNSPAQTAGIQAGDIILSYDGENIYEPGTLYRQTAEGSPGELVTVKLQRGDELVTVYVPRGPLGTRFRATRGAPPN